MQQFVLVRLKLVSRRVAKPTRLAESLSPAIEGLPTTIRRVPVIAPWQTMQINIARSTSPRALTISLLADV
jgi:hypothetical protein